MPIIRLTSTATCTHISGQGGLNNQELEVQPYKIWEERLRLTGS